MTEAMMDTPPMTSGKITALEWGRKWCGQQHGGHYGYQRKFHKVGGHAAQSPTLSPTLSAMTAGSGGRLRDAGFHFTTRSAPTSAALCRMRRQPGKEDTRESAKRDDQAWRRLGRIRGSKNL